MKSIQILCSFMIAFFFYFLVSPNVQAADVQVTSSKVWTITLNQSVDPTSVQPATVYVQNSAQQRQLVTLQTNGRQIIVSPPQGGYKANDRYELVISTSVKNNTGQAIATAFKKPFIVQDSYEVVTYDASGNKQTIKSYSTFEEAKAQLTAGHSIVKDARVIATAEGFVATNPAKEIKLYTDAKLTSMYHYTTVEKDSSFVYVDATEQAVKLHIAGIDLYAAANDVSILPAAITKDRSYYSVNADGLWHTIYRPTTGYDAAYFVGASPTFLNVNERYYSEDGIHFYNTQNKLVGESYNYFQYVSPRVPTSYSAIQLDTLIVSELKKREQLGYPRYAQASTNSRLLGIGHQLKEMEETYRLNALVILALAMHESDYGMSCHAQNYQNLFGLNVTDTNSQCVVPAVQTATKYYETINENLNALATHLNQKYLAVNRIDTFEYTGAALGNKRVGFNVRYASDPYWGAKTAGHVYRLDKALGGQDYKTYALAMTALAQVSVRTEPVVVNNANNNRAYQYKSEWTIKPLSTMPLTLATTPSPATNWSVVISELPTGATELYTVTENVIRLQTH